ncbi:MAG: helix-turn-helix domain-containing protein [Opitutales bacterium]
MQSIGERLEEARKRKGISLREAAEATKIRGDFLGFIEKNKFDFELPDIYKRGFLKNYARYLKLDPEQILADYNAQQLSQSRLAKKSGGSEWFGHMELKREKSPVDAAERAETPEPGTEQAPALGRIKAKSTPESEPPADEPEDDADKTFYLKVGLIFVGTLALVFVIFGLIWAILGSGNDEPPPPDTPTLQEDGSAADSESEPDPAPTDPEATGADTVTLTASGNVYVLVKQQEDNAELFRKTMSEGERVTLDKEGPVDILFTAGEFLTIEHDGERLRPSSPGTAKISLP